MAIHTRLPIYKAVYDLLVVVSALAGNMRRDFKTSIGGTLRDECVAMTILVFRANKAEDKVPYLDALLERQEVAGLLLRLSMDLHLISKAQYAKAVELVESVGKQANGWRSHSKRQFHGGHGHHG